VVKNHSILPFPFWQEEDAVSFNKVKQRIQHLDDVEFNRQRVSAIADVNAKKKRSQRIAIGAVGVLFCVFLLDLYCGRGDGIPTPDGMPPTKAVFVTYHQDVSGQRTFSFDILDPTDRNVTVFDGVVARLVDKDTAETFYYKTKASSTSSHTLRIVIIDPKLDALKNPPSNFDLVFLGENNTASNMIKIRTGKGGNMGQIR